MKLPLFFPVVFFISTIKSIVTENDYAFIAQKGDRVDCITNGPSAMSWIENFEESSNSVSVFIPFIPPTFDCKIAHGGFKSCTSFWTSTSWKIRNDQNGDIKDAVLDRRWEFDWLSLLNTTGINNHVPYRYIRDSSVLFSIRTECGANILFCAKDQSGKDICIWIILQECSSSQSEIRKCILDDPGTFDFNQNNKTVSCDSSSYIKISKNIVNKNEWKLMKVVQNGSQLFVYSREGLKENLFLHTNNLKVSNFITDLYVGGKKSLWKLQNFEYIQTNKVTNANLGPELFTKNGSLCLAMFVAMCRECILSLSLTSKFSNVTSSTRVYISKNPLRWREIKYIIENLPSSVLLYVSTNFIGKNASKPIWAIDNVRRCQKVEFRRITTNINNSTNSNINCQILTSNELIQLKSNVDSKIRLNNCSEDTVSQFCVPFKYINFGSSEIGMKICENYQNRTICSCSAGYSGKDCAKICPLGSYGHGCRKTCGKCAKTCNNIDGICDKCKDGFFGLKCDKPCPNGFYGSACNKICANCINNTCNNVDGTCLSCMIGFAGPKCDKPCPIGFYGQFCKVSCSTNCLNVCNHIHGNCSSCLNNFSGPKCEQEPPLDTRLYYGLIIFILLTILALIVYLAFRRRKEFKPERPKRLLMRNQENESSIKFSSTNQQQITSAETAKLPVGIDNFEQFVQNFENNEEMRKEIQIHFKLEPIYCEVLNPTQGAKFVDDDSNTYKIDGYNVPKAFLVIKNPKLMGPSDFWKFIWTKNIKNVIILNDDTKIQKHARHFWPNFCEDFGEITVKLLPAYSEIYEIERRTKKITVSRFEFTVCTNAPPVVVAQNFAPILGKLLKIPLESGSPILICCNTSLTIGTLLISDMSLRMASATGSINLFEYFEKLRQQIFNFPNTFDSFKLILVVILEYLTNFKDPLTCEDLVNLVNILDDDFVKLQIRCLKFSMERDQIKRVENKKTYRQPVFVDGFRTLKKFLIGEQPNEWISIDFWKNVINYKIAVIISLNEASDEELTCALWPNEKYPVITPFNSVTIQHSQTQIFETYKITTLNMYTAQNNEERNLQIVSLSNWRAGKLLPNDPVAFLKFREQSATFCQKIQPVMVVCRDGVTACGLYSAVTFLIEKITADRVWDVVKAVEIVRRNNKEFLIHEEQIAFLYEIASIIFE